MKLFIVWGYISMLSVWASSGIFLGLLLSTSYFNDTVPFLNFLNTWSLSQIWHKSCHFDILRKWLLYRERVRCVVDPSTAIHHTAPTKRAAKAPKPTQPSNQASPGWLVTGKRGRIRPEQKVEVSQVEINKLPGTWIDKKSTAAV